MLCKILLTIDSMSNNSKAKDKGWIKLIKDFFYLVMIAVDLKLRVTKQTFYGAKKETKPARCAERN